MVDAPHGYLDTRLVLASSGEVVAGLFGVIGVVVGAGLSWFVAWPQERRKARIAIGAVALKTLQGWRGLARAHRAKPTEPNNEKRQKRIDDANWFLTEHLISYEAALSAVTKRQGKGVHVKVIAETNAYVGSHDLERLGPGDLESLDHSTEDWAERIGQAK